MNTIFSQNLKEIRKEHGKTQKEVAEYLKVVESCYANWEQGRTEPDIQNIIKLCEYFKVTADDLLRKNPKNQIFFKSYTNNGIHKGPINIF